MARSHAHLLPSVQAPLVSPSGRRKSIRPCRVSRSVFSHCWVPKKSSANTRWSLSIASRFSRWTARRTSACFQSEAAAQGRSQAAPGAVQQPSVGNSPLGRFFLGLMRSAAPWIPPKSVPFFTNGSRVLAATEDGVWNRGQFRRSRAPWSGIAVLRADTPARNNSVLGHSGVHRCGCRTRTVRRSPRQRRRGRDSLRIGARPTQGVLNELCGHCSHAPLAV
jgi:hypothetical protein